jgi:hypothetical protein
VTVIGSGFGAEPSDTVTPAGDSTSVDFAKNDMYIEDVTRNLYAGQAGDLMGVNIQSWTPMTIVFSFGTYYGTQSTPYAAVFSPGDQFVLSVSGLPQYGPMTVPALNEGPLPEATVTYPNGAIVDFSGTDYVFAGSHPFEVSTPGDLATLQARDRATIVVAPAGAIPANIPPRAGTLLSLATGTSAPSVYVVGTDGEVHQFSDAAELQSDGYDPALETTVTDLAGLTIGPSVSTEGNLVDAYATLADGAIIDSGGVYYVLAGGRAFEVPSSALAAVQEADPANPLSGNVSTVQTTQEMANGVVLEVAGNLYVSYENALWLFTSASQFVSDGYGGTAAVTAPSTGGVVVVS